MFTLDSFSGSLTHESTVVQRARRAFPLTVLTFRIAPDETVLLLQNLDTLWTFAIQTHRVRLVELENSKVNLFEIVKCALVCELFMLRTSWGSYCSPFASFFVVASSARSSLKAPQIAKFAAVAKQCNSKVFGGNFGETLNPNTAAIKF